MKEFKVGDRVAILGTITSTTGGGEYSIMINVDNSKQTVDCTREGKYHKHDTQQNVRHLEDLQYMYGNYLAVHMKDVESFKKGKTVAIHQFTYVHLLTDNIKERNLIKERDELLNKLTDIIIEIQQSKNIML